MTLVCPQWGSGAQTSAGHVPTEVMLHAMPAPTARLLHSYARKPPVAYHTAVDARPTLESNSSVASSIESVCHVIYLFMAYLTTFVSFDLFPPKRPDWVRIAPSLLCNAHRGLLRRGYSGLSVKLTTHSHLVPRL